MIPEFFINIIYGVLFYIVTLLPNPDTLPEGIDDAFTAIASYWPTASSFFPLDVLFLIFGLGMTIEITILGFKVSNWVMNKVRGAG